MDVLVASQLPDIAGTASFHRVEMGDPRQLLGGPVIRTPELPLQGTSLIPDQGTKIPCRTPTAKIKRNGIMKFKKKG